MKKITGLFALAAALFLVSSVAFADGKLDIVTTPMNAEVHVNGNFIGQTPLLLTGLPEGTHLVEIRKDGHKDYSREVFVPEGKTVNLSIEMDRHRGKTERTRVRLRNSLIGAAVLNEIIHGKASKRDQRKDGRKIIFGAELLNELINR